MLKLFISAIVLSSAGAMQGQAAQPTLPAPIAAEQIQYRYWPEQFVQWVGSELPYSMIELYVDPTAKDGPLYDAVLTERATGKRTHYSNRQSMVDADKRQGAEAYLTQIQLDRPANPATGANYLVRFSDHTGEPVLWQFVQGSDITERGGGMSPAGAKPPVLMYRGQAAVAGDGTALKIGNTVSTADVWTEISQPPYFVAYHGALSEDVNIAVFAGTAQQWTTVSAPTALTAGAEWKLKAADGLGSTLQVQAVTQASQGTEATILENDEHLPGRTVTLEARWADGAWSIDKIHYAPAGADASQGVTIAFTPGVSATADTPSKFELFVGRKTKIATGTVHDDIKQARVAWEFKDPEWLRGKTAWVSSAAAGPEQPPTQAMAK
jgi:hypothetical protein